jgi:hypothetical protein
MLEGVKTHFLIQPQITPPTTEVLIGNDLLKEQILQPLCQKFGSKIAVFADKSIANSYGNLLQKKLNAELFIVPKGEEIKTRESCEKIEDALLKNSFGKSSVFIALGGGATTDAIGCEEFLLFSFQLRFLPWSMPQSGGKRPLILLLEKISLEQRTTPKPS